jgi:hypothetical protein
MDSLKCQTFTVSPAEPGDFPLWLILLRQIYLSDFEGESCIIAGMTRRLPPPERMSRSPPAVHAMQED